MEAGKLLTDISLDRAKNTLTFPVLHSTLSASDLLKEVEREYGIGAPTHCRLLHARLNDTYEVRTTDDRYFLRVYRSRWRTLPEITYELELLLHLRKKGVAVSTPIPRRDGSLIGAIRAPEGIRYTVLFTHAPGTPFYGQQIAQHPDLFGATMGAFHAAADDFHCSYTRRPLDLTLLLDEPLRVIQPLLSHRPQDWQRILPFVEQLRRHLTALGLKNLDWGPCHGDPTTANANIGQGQYVTMLDFDFCGPGWRAFDLASAYNVARTQSNPALWENFLQGYCKKRLLKDIDMQATPLFDTISSLWSEGLHAANGNEWGFDRFDDEHFDRILLNIQAWENFYVRYRGK